MTKYKIQEFPQSRIATIDISGLGKKKHHVTALIELDVSESRKKIRSYNQGKIHKISLTAWLISVISCTIKQFETSASYLAGKKKQIIFEDINVSMLVEKELNGQKVPIPLIIEKANEINIESITAKIAEARNEKIAAADIVLQKRTGSLEKLYYRLPGYSRRYIWRFLLRHPKIVYKKMGNVAFTSIGMMGKADGWFIPISVHPICFGVGSIIKKPKVIDDRIEIRETLNMTILMDHDVMDGAPMARFISTLTKNIESGLKL